MLERNDIHRDLKSANDFLSRIQPKKAIGSDLLPRLVDIHVFEKIPSDLFSWMICFKKYHMLHAIFKILNPTNEDCDQSEEEVSL